jgi:hypothetical protein
VDTFDPSTWCGVSSNAFQIRPIVVVDNPERLAIDSRDQRVAFRDVSSRVATTITSTGSWRGARVGARPAIRPDALPQTGFATCPAGYSRARLLAPVAITVDQCPTTRHSHRQPMNIAAAAGHNPLGVEPGHV